MFIKKVHLFLLTALLLVGNVSAWGTVAYEKVTNASSLVTDGTGVYILAADVSSTTHIATGFSNKALSTVSDGFMVNGDSIIITTASPLEFTLGGSSDGYTLSYMSGNNSHLLGFAGGNVADLSSSTEEPTENKAKWTFNSTDNSLYNVNTTDRFLGTGTSNSNIVFKAYKSSTQHVYLYKKQASITPTVLVSPAALDFGNDIEQGASVDAQTFTLAGYGLTGAISIAAPNSGFTVSPTSITPTDGIISATDITVTPVTSMTGTFNGEIIISGGGLVNSSTVALTMTVIPVVDVTGVTLDKSSLSLTAGESATLTSTIAPEEATNKNVVWSTSNSNVAKVSGGVVTAVGVGSATITVTSVADGTKSASCSITVSEAIPFGKITSSRSDWTGEYLLVYETVTHAVAWTGVDADYCGVSVTIANNVISIVPTSAVTLTMATVTDGYSVKVNGGTNNGKYIGMNSDVNGLNFYVTSKLNTISYGTEMNIVSSSAVLRYNSASNQQRFRYYKTDSYISQKAIQLYRKNYFPLTISSVGWASLYLPYAATIPTGVQAYYASSTDGENITLTEIKGTIPAYTGVVVRGTAGTYGFEKSDVSPAALSDNLLIGVTAPKDTTHSTAYVLAGVDPDDTNCILFKLYKNASDENDVTLGAYKSYIPKSVLPGSPDRIRFIIADGNNTTSIEATKANESAVKFVENGQLFIKRNDVVYDVMGRIVK